MSDIFISYAREDIATAEAIAKALEVQGWSVWWDRTIPAGRDFDEVIEKAIDEAKCIVVLWSKHSVSSRWVKTEAAEGADRHILVPVLIEDIKTPFAFRRIQAADFNAWDGQTESPLFQKFIRDVSDILGAAPPAEIKAAEAKAAEAKRQEQVEREAAETRHREAEAEIRLKAEEPEQQAQRETEHSAQEATATPATPEVEEPPRAQATEQAPTAVTQPNAWWLLLLLPLLTIHGWLGVIQLSTYYFVLPVAAWVGNRYGHRGLRVLALGLLPFWYGSPSFNGFSTPLAPGLYFVALVVCWFFAEPARAWRRLTELEITTPLIIGLFTLGGSTFLFISDYGKIGWTGSELLIAFGAFIVALTGRAYKAVLVVATAMLALGMTLAAQDIGRFSEDLGNGLRFVSQYLYNNVAEFLLVWVLLAFGRTLGDALRGNAPGPQFMWLRMYILFVLLWLVATHSVSLRGDGNVGLFGEPWLAMALAFIAGMLWQRTGLLVVGALVLFSFVESAILIEAGRSSFVWSLGGGVNDQGASGGYDLIWQARENMRQFGIYLAAVAFGYLGLRLSVGLGLKPGLRSEQSVATRWMSDTEKKPSKTVRPATPNPLLPWILLPLVPLLAIFHKLSRAIGFELEYLIVPAGAWLAWRYGRDGLKVFAIGALTYWIGFRFSGNTGIRLLPDMYLITLLLAWAIVYPERWLQKIRETHLSMAKHVAIIVLLPISAVLWLTDSLQVGWQTELLYPFALLLLGCIGASARTTLGLVAVTGVVGMVLLYPMGDLDIDRLQLSYELQSIRDILTVSLWYLAGLVLNRFYLGSTAEDNASQRLAQAVINWLKSPKGYAGLGLMLFLAPISLRITLPFGNFQVWGSVWLLMAGAFLAGFVWGVRGLHLTAAAAGGLVLLTSVIAPALDHRTFVLESGGGWFGMGIGTPGTSFALIAACALLYALLGKRLSDAQFTKSNVAQFE